MKIKRLLIFFSIFLFLLLFIFLAYNLAIWKAKKDIVLQIEKAARRKVYIGEFNLSIKKLGFKRLDFQGFHLRNFDLNYNIFKIITFRNIGELVIKRVEINLDSLNLISSRPQKGIQRIKLGATYPLLTLDEAKIETLVVVYKNKKYNFSDIKFSLYLKGDVFSGVFYFQSNFLNLKGVLNLFKKGDLIKISSNKLSSEYFNLGFDFQFKNKSFEASLYNLKFKDYLIDKASIIGKINKDIIDFEDIFIKSDFGTYNLSLSVEKFNFIKGICKGELIYKDLKSKILSNFSLDLNKKEYEGVLILGDIKYKNAFIKKIFFEGKANLNGIYPDSFLIVSDDINIKGKRKDTLIVLEINKIDFDAFKKILGINRDLGFVMKGRGLMKIKRKDFDLLVQGILQNFHFKELRSDLINFTFNRKNEVNQFTFSDSYFDFKNVSSFIEFAGLTFKKLDSFSYVLKGIVPFLGDVDEEGVFYTTKRKKGIILKSGYIEFYPVLKIDIDSTKFLGGILSVESLNHNKYKINLRNGYLDYLPYFNISSEIDIFGVVTLSNNFSPDQLNLNLKLKNFFYDFVSLDSLDLNVKKKEEYYFVEGDIYKGKGKGNVKAEIDNKGKFYFDLYEENFNALELGGFLRDILKLTKGFYSLHLKGMYDFKNKKYNYKAGLTAKNLSGSFYNLGVDFKNGELYLKFENDTFTYDFIGKSGQGKIKGNGWGFIKWGHDVITGGKISVSNVDLIPLSYIKANVSGEIEYRRDETGIEINGNFFVHKSFITPTELETEEEQGFSKLKLNLNLEGENIYIVSDFMNAELEGDLNIQSPDFIKRIYKGNFEVKRGTVFYLGRVFEILPGSKLSLKGEESFNPDLNILAETELYIPEEKKNIKVTVEIKGKLFSPVFTLKSEPPYSQTELLRMFTVGEEILGAGLIEGTISQELRKRLKLKELMITGLLKGDPTFTIGTYVSENLYIKYLQGVVDPTKNLYLIKYFILPGISIYAEKDEKGSAQGGVEIEIRF